MYRILLAVIIAAQSCRAGVDAGLYRLGQCGVTALRGCPHYTRNLMGDSFRGDTRTLWHLRTGMLCIVLMGRVYMEHWTSCLP